ncbi:MAG: hypothetical protein WCL02_07295 [bacterium]
MPKKRSRKPEKPGTIGKSIEPAIDKTANGIVSLTKASQIHTVKQSASPTLLQAIATRTSYPEVVTAAHANEYYPHPEQQRRTYQRV